VVESEYVIFLHFRGRTDSSRLRKVAATIRAQQTESGGWSIYPGGADDASATVKAYFALKLAGDDAEASHMRRARERALELGGVEATNTYTKIYLALVGQFPWSECPAIPPEMVLLPRGFPFNLYEMSSWSRAIFVPLSILWARRAVRPVPPGRGVEELFTGRGQPRDPREPVGWGRFWRHFFLGVDRTLKLLERLRIRPLREQGVRAAERWILERQPGSDGLAAILPGILNAMMAFDVLGYPPDHPAIRHEEEGLERLLLEDGDEVRVQPALSPVWDTAHSASILIDAGMESEDPAVLSAARWLLDHEVRRPGDWTYGNPDAEASGWYFEYANEFYPDCDDTTAVLGALSRITPRDDPELGRRLEEARERGLRWLLSMQNDDGGWAAFDRNCDREALRWVPFADHNAMLDLSCPDITGRALELFGDLGFPRDHPAVTRAIRYLHETQEPDGSWYGRWGCNYVYGTWLALSGLARYEPDSRVVREGARWLEAHQNEDGGWGETLASYEDPSLRGQGRSTAAQTAWALLGLLAAGRGDRPPVRRGIDYLVRTEEEEGAWDDERWTGTGFPRVFNLRYHFYDLYFPILALSTYLDTTRER